MLSDRIANQMDELAAAAYTRERRAIYGLVALALLTLGVGVAVANQDDRDIQAVIERADIALYAAKDAGRNRIAVAPVSTQRKARTA